MVSNVTDLSRKNLEKAFFGDEPDWKAEALKKYKFGKIFLIEQALGINLDAVEKDKPRLDNKDLDRILDALIDKTDSRKKYERVLNE